MIYISKLLSPKSLLVLVILLFLITRLYKINEIPPSVYWDEASIGYNAYSIAQDGKDEWGKFLPIHLRAFGEFKLPVYVYSVVPFVKLFGLNEISVRFPAVLYSLGIIFLTYLLTKKIFNNSGVGIWSSFLVTISPWFFIFSRTGYEVTAGLMFYLLGIYLFLKLSESKWCVVFSSVSFVLSAYSYNSFRIIIPLTLLILIFVEKNIFLYTVKKYIGTFFLAFIIILLSLVPIYRLYKFDAGSSRFQTVAIRNGTEFFKNYLSHFTPNFLFISGDINLRSQQAGFGQLYFPELFFLFGGLLYIIGSNSKYRWLPVLFLLLGPIPASLTKESPHALRSLSMAPFFATLSACGVLYIERILKWKFIKGFVLLIFLILFLNYLIHFYSNYSIESSKDWQYGYKKIYTDFQKDFSKYDRVIISDEYAQPYIFALFYLNYSPDLFRRSVIRNSVDQWSFSSVYKFDKFEFGKTNKLDSNIKNVLVFSDKEITGKNPSEFVKFLDGSIAFWVYRL